MKEPSLLRKEENCDEKGGMISRRSQASWMKYVEEVPASVSDVRNFKE